MILARDKRSSQKRPFLKILIWLFFLVILSFLSLGILLKNGIRLDSLNIGNISLSNFYLVWKDRLELDVDTVHIRLSERSTDSQNDLQPIRSAIYAGVRLTRVFSRLNVGSMVIDDMERTTTFSINTDHDPWVLAVISDGLEVNTAVSYDQGMLRVDIIDAFSRDYNSSGSGSFIIDTNKEEINGTISVAIAAHQPLVIDLKVDKNQIAFQNKELIILSSIKEIVDLFNMDPDIQPWITEYLQGSGYELKNLSGTIPWNDPGQIVESLQGEVSIDRCKYTFARGLEPIKTGSTDVIYKKGVLSIIPNRSTFYDQSTEDSWLDINFNDPDNIILNTYITTNAMVNEDILGLLSYYEIDFPFRQVKGKTSTNLTLTINLSNGDVNALGTFLVDQGTMLWNDEEFKVVNARVGLKDADITIEELVVGIEDFVEAGVTGNFNAEKNLGKLDIVLHDLSIPLKGGQLKANNSKPPPAFTYHISPATHTLEASASSWTLGSFDLELGAFTAPISMDGLSAAIPPTRLTSLPIFDATLAGTYSLPLQKANLECDLVTFNIDGLQLLSSHVPLGIQYDKSWKFITNQESRWDYKGTPVKLSAIDFGYDNSTYSARNSSIEYGNFFKTTLSGRYKEISSEGSFALSNLYVVDNSLGDLKGTIKATGKGIAIELADIDLSIGVDASKRVTAVLGDLKPLHDRSKLLQLLKIEKGKVELASSNGGNLYTFNGTILDPLPILYKEGAPVDIFYITGRLTKEGVEARVNEEVDLLIADQWKVSSKNVDYNIAEIVRLFNSFSQKTSPKDKDDESLEIDLEVHNSSLFLRKGSEILADDIKLTHIDGATAIHLAHGLGSIDISAEGDQFQLVGRNLNNVFMDALFQEADFRQGEMSMVASGSFDNFSAVIEMEDVIFEKFTTLNKTLSVLNTIPALATFSLPQFSNKGFKVTSARAGMVVEDGVADVKAFDLQSPQLSITGSGWVDIPQKTMDMDLNLITQAKTNLSKIPFFGYIMVGDKKKPSLTVNVKGDLANPEVKYSMFKEVSTIPFSVIYRTFSLPKNLVKPLYNSKGEPLDQDNQIPSAKDLEREAE